MAMATGSAFAQIPEIISYQGVDPTNPNATITVNATLYDAATGGTNVWTQQSMPTTDANGMFMMMLGPTGTPALGSLDWTKQYWLELSINGTAISPRTQLTTSPYAFEAGEAMSVADGAITAASFSTDGTAPTDGQVLTYDPGAPGSLKWSTVSGGGGGGAIDAVVAGPGIQVTTAGGTVTVSLAAGGITGSMIADGAINSQHLAPGAVLSSQIAAFAVLTQHIGPQQVTLPKLNTQGANSGEAIMFNGTQLIYGNPTPGGPAGGELSGTYPNPIIADNVIDGANVIDESLTGADILNESIGVDDIGPDAVGTSEIINESILAEDIATGAVTTDEILNETILAEDIATGAVTTDEILNETILSEDIMNGTIQTDDMMPGNPWTALMTDGFGNVMWDSINSETIADETIQAIDIATGAVRTQEILNETILSEDIMDGQVMTVDIADLAVTNQKVGPDAITTDKILDGEVMNPDLATDAVDSRVIQNESIMTQDIQDGQVMSVDIQDGGVNTIDLADGSVTTVKIADQAVTTAKIADQAVTNSKIAPDAVTTDKIMNLGVQREDIADNAINGAKIEDETVTGADIDNETVTADDLAVGSVTTDEILNATILEEDIAASAGPADYLQSNGTTVFWGPPAMGSIPASAITPGMAHQVLTTNGAGTLSEWDFIETANIDDLAVTNPKLAADAVTTDKILDQDVAPIDLEPSAVDGQVLKTVAGTVVWANDDITLPFSGTDATAGVWAFEVIKTALSEGAIRGEIDNAGNAQAAILGETNGTGAGVMGLATGAGNGGEFESQGAGTALVVNATGAGEGIEVTTNGGNAIVADAPAGGSAIIASATGADAVVVTAANGNNGVTSTVTGGGDAIVATNNGGAGRAIVGENTNAANANAAALFQSVGAVANNTGVLRVELNNAVSTGWTGYFSSTGGTGNGVWIQTDDAGDAMALHLERGGMKLSSRNAAANYTVQADDIVVYVQDNAVAASTYTITLPATGDDGQILWILNGDVDAMGVVAGTLAGPISHATTAISGNRGMGFVYSTTEAAWIPAGNL